VSPPSAAYAETLGMQIVELAEEHARLVLPFREANANPGGALHGGCAASLAAAGAHAVAAQALGDETPLVTASLQVTYLAAAIREQVQAEARLLRRGKELCFVDVAVASAGGRAVARALAAVAKPAGEDAGPLPAAAGDDGAAEPGPMGPHVEKLGFIAARGIRIEHMTGSRSRLRMPWSPGHGDGHGGLHEGAALALLDTAGAMASWAETGPGPFKASTPAVHAQVLAPLPAAEMVAYGHCVRRDGALLWSDVELADAATGLVHLRGTVLYRIVTGAGEPS
jgi:uncharacterized protein (TIGR00369 family)